MARRSSSDSAYQHASGPPAACIWQRAATALQLHAGHAHCAASFELAQRWSVAMDGAACHACILLPRAHLHRLQLIRLQAAPRARRCLQRRCFACAQRWVAPRLHSRCALSLPAAQTCTLLALLLHGNAYCLRSCHAPLRTVAGQACAVTDHLARLSVVPSAQLRCLLCLLQRPRAALCGCFSCCFCGCVASAREFWCDDRDFEVGRSGASMQL
jgi:hypothetical protein